MAVHKRLVTETHVVPKSRKAYMRVNYNQTVCLYPWSYLSKTDTVTANDEMVTCPACLRKMGGR